MTATARPAPMSWAAMKPGAEEGAMPANVFVRVRARATDGVGEAGGRREPVGGADVARHRDRDGGAPTAPHHPEAHGEQPEGGDHLREERGRGETIVSGQRYRGKRKHHVGHHRTEAPTRDRGAQIGSDEATLRLARDELDEGDRRVEVAAETGMEERCPVVPGRRPPQSVRRDRGPSR